MKSWLALAGLLSAQICLADPSTPVIWTKGPGRVSLAEYGQVDVPPGFKFADGENARLFLHAAKSAKNSGQLLGILMPASGGWYVSLEYFDIGHVTDAGLINEKAILSALEPRVKELNKGRELRGQPQLANIRWELKPAYQAESHSLEWALRGEGISGDSVVDYSCRVLGRRGVLQAAATLFRTGAGLDQIRDMMSSLVFKRGEMYADFQASDKASTLNVASLATTPFAVPRAAETSSSAETFGGANAFWIGLGVLGCVGVAGGGFLAKKLRQQRASSSQELDQEEELPAPAPVPASNGGLKLHGMKSLKANGREKPARNGNALSGLNGQGGANKANGNGKRKRMFNYHKFYTEMVLQGPAPVIMDSYNGYDNEPLRYNNNHQGNGNGRHNGNGNGNGSHQKTNSHTNGNGHNGGSDSQQPSVGSVITAHSDLIASQKSFIEDQKRLIHEQARLIEEKSRLIAEKSLLLDKQTQMLENDLL
jgi:uncharacterized membrane-anchored protein